MLVFTRKRDQAIVIGDGIEVRVLRIGREGVRLGITAADHVPLHRLEIYEAARRANAQAASLDSAALEALAARLRGGSGRE